MGLPSSSILAAFAIASAVDGGEKRQRPMLCPRLDAVKTFTRQASEQEPLASQRGPA
jgi:hypothetical protein